MKNNRCHSILALALGLTTLTVPAFAQGTTSGTGQGTTGQGTTTQGTTGQGTNNQGQGQGRQGGTLSNQDRMFVTDAAASNMMEIETGRLASQKAASADVKAFGQRMVTDHTQASTRLMQTVSNKGMTLPREMPASHRQHVDQLNRLSGAEFDRMYLQHMVMAHDKDVANFEKQSRNGSDPAVRSFAQQTLPTLREHQRMVRELASKHGVNVPNDHSARGSNNSGSH